MDRHKDRDPFLGAPGHFDGTDRSILEKEDLSKITDPLEREALQEIYGDIFGDERMSPIESSDKE